MTGRDVQLRILELSKQSGLKMVNSSGLQVILRLLER